MAGKIYTWSKPQEVTIHNIRLSCFPVLAISVTFCKGVDIRGEGGTVSWYERRERERIFRLGPSHARSVDSKD
jgi:hypothetical protein